MIQQKGLRTSTSSRTIGYIAIVFFCAYSCALIEETTHWCSVQLFMWKATRLLWRESPLIFSTKPDVVGEIIPAILGIEARPSLPASSAPASTTPSGSVGETKNRDGSDGAVGRTGTLPESSSVSGGMAVEGETPRDEVAKETRKSSLSGDKVRSKITPEEGEVDGDAAMADLTVSCFEMCMSKEEW